MDRDKRWERTQLAYDLLARGKAAHHAHDRTPRRRCRVRARTRTTSSCLPTIVGDVRSRSPTAMRSIFFNFRPDRARELTLAFYAGTTAYYDDGSASSLRSGTPIRSSRR